MVKIACVACCIQQITKTYTMFEGMKLMQFLVLRLEKAQEDIKDYINRELNKFDINYLIENIVNF